MLFRLSYVREMTNEYARLESNQRPLPSRGSALSTELRSVSSGRDLNTPTSQRHAVGRSYR